MNDGVKRYRAGYEGEMYQIAYIDEEVGKDEPDPILRDVWVADADYDALAAQLEEMRVLLLEGWAISCAGAETHKCPEGCQFCAWADKARAFLASATLQETKP
jgi:hypothetical protein